MHRCIVQCKLFLQSTEFLKVIIYFSSTFLNSSWTQCVYHDLLWLFFVFIHSSHGLWLFYWNADSAGNLAKQTWLARVSELPLLFRLGLLDGHLILNNSGLINKSGSAHNTSLTHGDQRDQPGPPVEAGWGSQRSGGSQKSGGQKTWLLYREPPFIDAFVVRCRT